ncbi:MAG: AarF/UbiB family protein [Pseudomonadota bacterium]
MTYVRRFAQINFALTGYLAWRLGVSLGLWRSRITPAQKFSRTLEGLGGAFIKLGQGLSLRHDLLPDDYLVALQNLQDRAAPFPGAAALREIQQAFGKPIEDLFAEFDEQAMAAASIAQVHKARMHDGRPVVVKVRRPGIKAQIDQDMRMLRMLLRCLLFLMPGLRQYQPLEIVREIWINLRKETDFRQEARSIRRFAEGFKNSAGIYIPTVVDDLYTESVLVQEMSAGARVDAPALVERGQQLTEVFVDAYLHQFFVMGVFHGDPHPGNLFIMEDGRICFHDFGLTGFLDRATRRNLAAFLQAFVHQDSGWMLDSYLDLGVLGGTLDRAEFQHGLDELLADYATLPLQEWSLAEAFLRIARLGRGQNIRIPHNLLVLMRTLFLMENVVRTLNPKFNLMDGLVGKAEQVLQASVRDAKLEEITARLRYETSLAVQDMPASLSALVRRLRTEGLQLRLHHHGLEDLESHIDRSSNRMALALVTLGLYIAASLLMQHSLGPRLGEVPMLAVFGYALALWFTFRLVRGISRSGRL